LLSLVPNPLIIPVGILIGILIALPIGPINVLALQRAAERGFFGGLAAGLGIMLGDALIALAAAFSIKALSQMLSAYRWAIQIIGGIALIASGLKLLLAPTVFHTVEEAAKTTLADYAWDIPKHFLLTVTNPNAVLFLIAIFGAVSSFVEVATKTDAIAITLAIMAGSFAYWLVAAHLIYRIRHRLDYGSMRRINQGAALALIALGLVLAGEVAWKAIQ